mmetsp:Transcript_24591/g.68484  ORF Transcript_24591/g.68484 Transcript_24591/m.68484 type:complete len:330 (+) Transcript_24591:329-1318(+)
MEFGRVAVRQINLALDKVREGVHEEVTLLLRRSPHLCAWRSLRLSASQQALVAKAAEGGNVELRAALHGAAEGGGRAQWTSCAMCHERHSGDAVDVRSLKYARLADEGPNKLLWGGVQRGGVHLRWLQSFPTCQRDSSILACSISVRVAARSCRPLVHGTMGVRPCGLHFACVVSCHHARDGDGHPRYKSDNAIGRHGGLRLAPRAGPAAQEALGRRGEQDVLGPEVHVQPAARVSLRQHPEQERGQLMETLLWKEAPCLEAILEVLGACVLGNDGTDAHILEEDRPLEHRYTCQAREVRKHLALVLPEVKTRAERHLNNDSVLTVERV